MTVLIDSFAWFEYFFGSDRGKTVKAVLDSNEKVVISSVNLIEVYSKYLKTAKREAEEKKNFIMSRSEIIGLTVEISLEASRIKAEYGLGLADAIILATARHEKALLLTGDSDFRGFENVRMI